MATKQQMRRMIRDASEELKHAKAWLQFYVRVNDWDAACTASRDCAHWHGERVFRQDEYDRAFKPAHKPVVVRGWDRVEA